MVSQKNAPVDRGYVTAIIIFILGLGTLLPWNFFMTATQYFNHRLQDNSANRTVNHNSSMTTAVALSAKDYQFDSWMALLSQIPLLLFTLLNSFLYHCVPERVRIAFSMVSILLLFSLTAALVHLPMNPDSFFSITMVTIWFINTFSAVLQGSLFGLVVKLPPKYSAVFMTGQGLAGIFAALAMLISLLSNGDKTSAALGYFITPCVATLVSLALYLILPHLKFAHFYLGRSEQPETTNEPIKSGEKLPLDYSPPDGFNSTTMANGPEKSKFITKPTENEKRSSVLAVFRKIWTMALSVTCVFVVTLSVFPVITVRVQTVYQENPTWKEVFTCVCCFIVFNVMDVAGRSAPSLVQWPPKESRLFPVAVVSRLVFIPLFMMCNIPKSSLPVLFTHDSAFVAIMTLFALSNGYFACLAMSYAPQLVKPKDCETAGILMMFFLALGLSLGAAFSFLLGKLAEIS